MAGNRWKPGDVDALIGMIARGVPRKQIARHFGRSTDGIAHKVVYLGEEMAKTKRDRQPDDAPWSDVDVFILRTMRAKGASDQEAAEVLGRSLKCVARKTQDMPTPGRWQRNWRPIGTEVVNGHGYLVRKVSDTGNQKKDWKRVDVIEWEALHGPVPDGYLLMVINQYLPRTPNNLQLVKKDDQWKTVIAQDAPPEVRQVMNLRKKIISALKKRSAA